MSEKLFRLKSKQFVNEWAKKLTPIKIVDRKYHVLEHSADNFNQAYLWDAKVGREIPHHWMDDQPGLVPTGVIGTLHTWGYYGFFKPTIAEIISQTPVSLLKKSKYFRIVGPADADDMNRHGDVLNAGYHVATVTFYADKPKKTVDDMPLLQKATS